MIKLFDIELLFMNLSNQAKKYNRVFFQIGLKEVSLT